MNRVLRNTGLALLALVAAGWLGCEGLASFAPHFELTVTSPRNNATVSSSVLTIKFKEARETDVARRVYVLNGGPETDMPNPTVMTTGFQEYSVTFTLSGLAEGANEIIVRSYDSAGRNAGAAVTVRYVAPYVTLDNDLFIQGVTTHHAGDQISLTRITGGHVANPDLCHDRHLHADAIDGIMIDGAGPYADPNPGGCGFGTVVGA